MINQYNNKNLPSAINLDEAISKRFGDTNCLKITDYDNNSIPLRNNSKTLISTITLLLVWNPYLYKQRLYLYSLELCTET